MSPTSYQAAPPRVRWSAYLSPHPRTVNEKSSRPATIFTIPRIGALLARLSTARITRSAIITRRCFTLRSAITARCVLALGSALFSARCSLTLRSAITTRRVLGLRSTRGRTITTRRSLTLRSAITTRRVLGLRSARGRTITTRRSLTLRSALAARRVLGLRSAIVTTRSTLFSARRSLALRSALIARRSLTLRSALAARRVLGLRSTRGRTITTRRSLTLRSALAALSALRPALVTRRCSLATRSALSATGCARGSIRRARTPTRTDLATTRTVTHRHASRRVADLSTHFTTHLASGSAAPSTSGSAPLGLLVFEVVGRRTALERALLHRTKEAHSQRGELLLRELAQLAGAQALGGDPREGDAYEANHEEARRVGHAVNLAGASLAEGHLNPGRARARRRVFTGRSLTEHVHLGGLGLRRTLVGV